MQYLITKSNMWNQLWTNPVSNLKGFQNCVERLLLATKTLRLESTSFCNLCRKHKFYCKLYFVDYYWLSLSDSNYQILAKPFIKCIFFNIRSNCTELQDHVCIPEDATRMIWSAYSNLQHYWIFCVDPMYSGQGRLLKVR